jgi:TRAP-type mannitol/chloroaromatic compound transport system permease small subunit
MSPRIPRCHAALGWICRALVVAMILVGAFNAIGRYAGKFTGVYLSSNAYLELQAQLFALMFLLGGAYTLFHDAHVRVDILHERMTSRTRAWVEAIGTLCLHCADCPPPVPQQHLGIDRQPTGVVPAGLNGHR